MKLKIKRTIELEINDKPVEKHVQEILVYKNEGKRKYQRVIGIRDTYYCPKDKNGTPDLNWANRPWDDWDDNPDVLKKKLSLFWP